MGGLGGGKGARQGKAGKALRKALRLLAEPAIPRRSVLLLTVRSRKGVTRRRGDRRRRAYIHVVGLEVRQHRCAAHFHRSRLLQLRHYNGEGLHALFEDVKE